MDLKGITHVYEPFMGTAAVSVYLSSLYPKQFTYGLNDMDSQLVALYETARRGGIAALEREIGRAHV